MNAESRETATVAFVGVLLLYGQLFAYGYWVAAGVVEEKSSRVVEVLLATLRPLAPVARQDPRDRAPRALAAPADRAGRTVRVVRGRNARVPSGAIATVGLVLVWFVLGFFFYATMFAVAGSIVTRQEDLRRR